jgi:hypothetical protein
VTADSPAVLRRLGQQHPGSFAQAWISGGGPDYVRQLLDHAERAGGFVEAMRDALRAYLRFASADRLAWAPRLATEKRLFLTGP